MDNKLGTFWPYKKGRIGIAKVPQFPFGFSVEPTFYTCYPNYNVTVGTIY